jgi:chromosome segregation ATPase
LETTLEEQKELKTQKEQLTLHSSNLKETLQQADELLQSKQMSLSETTNLYASLKKEISEKKSSDIDIHNQLEDLKLSSSGKK